MISRLILGHALLSVLCLSLSRAETTQLPAETDTSVLCVDRHGGSMPCHDIDLTCYQDLQLAVRLSMQYLTPSTAQPQSVDLTYRTPADRLRDEAERIERQDADIRTIVNIWKRCVPARKDMP